MEDIYDCIKKIENLIDYNKNTIISVFDKDFIYFLKKLLRRILKKEDNYRYTIKISKIMGIINSEIGDKYLCEKKKDVLIELKQLLKKLFILICIKYSSE